MLFRNVYYYFLAQIFLVYFVYVYFWKPRCTLTGKKLIKPEHYFEIFSNSFKTQILLNLRSESGPLASKKPRIVLILKWATYGP